jgi:hypothetical protein
MVKNGEDLDPTYSMVASRHVHGLVWISFGTKIHTYGIIIKVLLVRFWMSH